MNVRIEDLGVQATENVYNIAALATDPATEREVAVVCNFVGGGFTVFDLIARTARDIGPGCAATCVRNIAVGPDGAIYQRNATSLCRWDWDGDEMTVLADLPYTMTFTIDVAPDGRVFLPVYGDNMMASYDPATGTSADHGDYHAFGLHIRNVVCGRDGLVYVTCSDHHTFSVVALDPQTGDKHVVAHPDRPGASFGMVYKDGRGRVIVPLHKWGRKYHYELVGGKAVGVDQHDVMMAEDRVESSHVAFSDGSYMTGLTDRTLHFINAEGDPDSFDFDKVGRPLALFSVAAGAGRIWIGTILPLRLVSYDVQTGETTAHGDPVLGGGGEIYSMVFSQRKLFMASYGHAKLTRLDVDQPYLIDNTVRSNPGYLGDIKPGTRANELLHRPRGRALAPDGTVFFAATGSYGCEDGGVCRIDPDTEAVTRWIFKDREFDALAYLPALDQLVVSDVRKGETGIRFLFLSAQTGEVVRDDVVIDDNGAVTDWLHDGGDLLYGLHNHRATLFAYSLSAHRIVRTLPELGCGDHCYNTLTVGPDDRIWGLTNQCVYAVDRDLSVVERLGDYESTPGFYRFGMCRADDGHYYFPNGPRLMRVCVE
jgi:hypothetical protein